MSISLSISCPSHRLPLLSQWQAFWSTPEAQSLLATLKTADRSISSDLQWLYAGELPALDPTTAPLASPHRLGLTFGLPPHYAYSLLCWTAVQLDCRDDQGYFFFYHSYKMRVVVGLTDSNAFSVNEHGLIIDLGRTDGVVQHWLNRLKGIDLELESEIMHALHRAWISFQQAHPVALFTENTAPA